MGKTSRRVALALESSGPGGAENLVLRLADGLRLAGHDPIVVTTRPGWMTERAEASRFPVWIVPQQQGMDPGWIPSFARRLRKERIELLHTHEFAMNVYGGTAALLAGVPSLATIHGRHWIADRPRRVLAYKVLRRAGMPLTAVSRDLARFLADRFRIPIDTISVVHNGIPIPPIVTPAEREKRRMDARVALGIPSDGPLLVAVGNLYGVKDHASLLRAAAMLPDVRVAIAGRGEEEEPLRKLAATLAIDKRTHLLGLRDDIDRVLRAADVFVQPSRSEGLPLAILEAMAAGLPVVATRVGGMAEAIVDGVTGLLVEPGDLAALAAALRTIVTTPGRSAALGQKGRARAAGEFSLDRMVDRYRHLYAVLGLDVHDDRVARLAPLAPTS
jgi:glycosyltransferase involved in cell wall biosynthesis